MWQQINKYKSKLVQRGLADPSFLSLSALDAEISYAGPDDLRDLHRELYRRLNVMGLILARPPAGIIDALLLTESAPGRIFPRDCETRTFLHDIPVVSADCAFGELVDRLTSVLKERKGAIIAGRGVIAHGSVTLEQAFVTYSSILHAAFIKYHLDFARRLETYAGDPRCVNDRSETIEASISTYLEIQKALLAGKKVIAGPLKSSPFDGRSAIEDAIGECGRCTVEAGLVDSYFGNVSYNDGRTIWISQTASSLDELPGFIDEVPLDGSSSVGITASSELPAHMVTAKLTSNRAILHGHPKYSVIMSMLCREDGCRETECDTRCSRERSVSGIPVVIGEIGAGGLARSVPRALSTAPSVIVYGHGVFSVGRNDFRDAFAALAATEEKCAASYLNEQATRIERIRSS